MTLSWIFFLLLQAAPETLPDAEKILVLPIHDEEDYMVDQVQAEFIIEALETAEERGFKAIILTIDTYGGIVHSAREINEKLLRTDIPTFAYVEKKAISAGTFIAFACDAIAMEKLTTMGDAQVIMQTAEGIEEAPEKVVSVYRSDWKKACDAKGHSFALVQGFFDVEAEVLHVGEEGSAQFMLRSDYDELAEDERPTILSVVSKKDQLLTLHAEEAARLGIASVHDNFDDFLESNGFQPSQIERLDMDFNQRALRFLGLNSWVFGLLILIGLNGLYTEIKAPGFGIPGFTAIVCFILVFGSRYLLGTASPLEISLFALGIVLTLVEIFVTPGLGIIGFSGLGLVVLSLVMTFLPDLGPVIPQHDVEWSLFNRGITTVLIAVVLSFFTFALGFPLFLKIPFVQARLGVPDLTTESGFVMDTVEDRDQLIGQRVCVEGGLRPGGKGRFEDGSLRDVVSHGPFIDDGAWVIVQSVDGNRIVVHSEEEA